MQLNEKHFRQVLSLRYGKTILVCQVVMVIGGMYAFFKTVPWLFSENISEISKHENPTPPPPAWAHAFFVNHSTFHYYHDSRSDAPLRMWSYVGLLLIPILGSAITSRWVDRQIAKSAPSVADQDSVVDFTESNPHREELMLIVTRFLGIPQQGLTPETHFEDDLRVPPGELNDLLEDVQEHFGISFETRRINTFGDLLELIELDAK